MSNNKDLDPMNVYSYDRELNWYFNAANIPNQNAAFDTRNFLERHRNSIIDVAKFFNLLFKQKDEIVNYLDKPFDFIKHLQEIPIAPIEYYTLLGMLLYWHGGNPENLIETDTDSVNRKTILKLVKEEFDRCFTNADMPEKAFCLNEAAQRRLKDIVANLSPEMKAQKFRLIPSSDYFSEIRIDFEGLPHYVVQKGIVQRWEGGRLRKDSDYEQWGNELLRFLDTIPADMRLLALKKGIEYGRKCWDYHLAMECDNPEVCVLNESWERRITIANRILEAIGGQTRTEKPLTTERAKQLYKLSTKRGTKTDFIRVLNALYEAQFFFLIDSGEIPTKGEFMKHVGEVFGLDLKDYHSDLSQAFAGGLEANFNIFKRLQTITENAILGKEGKE